MGLCLLQFPLEERPEVLHPAAVHTQVAIASSRGRSEVNGLAGVVEDELHVIDKPEEQARKLVVEITLLFLNELRTGQAGNYCLQKFFRFSPRSPVGIGCNGMLRIFSRRECGHTVRAGGARSKRSATHLGAHCTRLSDLPQPDFHDHHGTPPFAFTFVKELDAA